MMILLIVCMFLSPYVIEIIFDRMGWLAIPNDELMPRYLALVKHRGDRVKESKTTTL